MIKIIENWFAAADNEVVKAVRAEYKDYIFDGITWPHIAITEDQESIDKASEILGFPLETSFPAYYRFYLETDSQPMHVHSDVNEGEYTVLIFLNTTNKINGLAFWEHLASSKDRATKEDPFFYVSDSNDLTKWSSPVIVPAQYNRAVIFEAAQFHSRWPANGWDIGAETARLVKVLFLRRKKQL